MKKLLLCSLTLATAPLKLANGREVTLASVLPGGAPALVRAEGEILLGVQLSASSDDISRDLAANHFDGQRRLSDPSFWANGPPPEGFLRVYQGAAFEKIAVRFIHYNDRVHCSCEIEDLRPIESVPSRVIRRADEDDLGRACR